MAQLDLWKIGGWYSWSCGAVSNLVLGSAKAAQIVLRGGCCSSTFPGRQLGGVIILIKSLLEDLR